MQEMHMQKDSCSISIINSQNQKDAVRLEWRDGYAGSDISVP